MLYESIRFLLEVRMGRRPFVREKILDAAFDLFARRGYEAVSTRDIAAQAKVGHASMYRHFESKEILGREVYSRALAPLLVAFSEMEEQADPPALFLDHCVARLCAWYDTRPRALALLVFPPHDFSPEELREENPKNPRRVLQRVVGCNDDTLAVIWGALTGPLQDRYLRRRTGAMAPAAKDLAKVIGRLIEVHGEGRSTA